MKSIHPSDKNFPIEMESFINCIKNISEKISQEEILAVGTICQEHLIADYSETIQSNGFAIKLVFEVNEKNETDIIVEEVIFYDNMDEWLDALNELNKRKKI